MPRGSSKGSKSFQKKVKEIVRDELKDELEEKTALIGLEASSINANIPSGDVTAVPNFVRLFPNILQANSAKQYNGRSGNEIRLKSLNLKMLLQWVNPATSDTNESSLGVRVMILKQKDQMSHLGAISDFQGTKLIENGLITVPGPAPFNGTTINLMQKINREQFAVRYDKVIYMNRPDRS